MPAHTCTAITRAIAHWGSPKKAELLPNSASTLAAGPPEGLKINPKISPITVTPRMVGMKTMARTKLRPRSFMFSSTAISSANPFCSSVTAIAKMKVFLSALTL